MNRWWYLPRDVPMVADPERERISRGGYNPADLDPCAVQCQVCGMRGCRAADDRARQRPRRVWWRFWR